MQVRRLRNPNDGGGSCCQLLDDSVQPIAVVDGFLQHLAARGYSPNTLLAYAYDLLHFMSFLNESNLTYRDFTAARSLAFLEYLRHINSRGATRSSGPQLAVKGGQPIRRLAATTINRIFAAVSSFYEYLILSDQWPNMANPIQQEFDGESARVPDGNRPFLSGISRQRPVRRIVRVRTIQRIPRPMTREQIEKLLGSLQMLRDKALVLLMLHGGLRPGEVLNLQMEDVQYGRRRVIIRHRTDHPRGVRTKSRTERVVDLYQAETLQTLNAYVMKERPQEVESPYIFLVGGSGKRRGQPLSYHALVKMFERHCGRVNIRVPWITPHALRHTHATEMWEGGMRELTLQKRLGHSSPESTRSYTRVSDETVVAEYLQALGGQEKR